MMLQILKLLFDRLWAALACPGGVHYVSGAQSLPPPLTPEEFSSPLLGKIYGAMWHQRGNRSGLSALTGELSGDEMSHLTTLLQKPESTANASQALADYIRVIREEQTKRDDSGVDPLLLAMETFKDKKRYGGKRT